MAFFLSLPPLDPLDPFEPFDLPLGSALKAFATAFARFVSSDCFAAASERNAFVGLS